MKKLFLFSVIVLLSIQSKSQFLNGIGITGGVSACKQKFFFYNPDDISKKNYLLGLNGSVFAEFFSHDHFRWVTEFQFNQKGSIDKEPEANYKNRLQYISWNNYLKIRYELFSCIPYILIGPRLDYNLTQNTSSPTITGNFVPFHISGAFGGGVEFISFSNLKFLVEGFYNPDIMYAYKTPDLNIKNKNIELRVGLKYEFQVKRESCNSPRYIEE